MKEISKARRRNAKLYPYYKMVSWDLLFFYSIEYLFYTMVKKVDASNLLIINAMYLIFSILMQIPAVMIVDLLKKRKSIILGNILYAISLIILIVIPGAFSIIIHNLFFALGYSIKIISEANLLYDSVSTKGGEGLYSKLDGKGGSLYYILDGVASLTAGYLFVINAYIPMYICLGFVILSIVLSFRFKDIYVVKEKTEKLEIKSYLKDVKKVFKFMIKSKRMRAFILFNCAFFSLIKIVAIYKCDLLVSTGIGEEQYSMIFAILTLIGGLSISFKKIIEQKFKNRTLTFISLLYVLSFLALAIVAKTIKNEVKIPLMLILLAICTMCSSVWWILEYKYLNSFTKENTRTKETFVYEFIAGIVASIFSILAGLLLKVLSIEKSSILVGIFFLGFIVFALDYMRTRFRIKT